MCLYKHYFIINIIFFKYTVGGILILIVFKNIIINEFFLYIGSGKINEKSLWTFYVLLYKLLSIVIGSFKLCEPISVNKTKQLESGEYK
jgi:hypothetical protein